MESVQAQHIARTIYLPTPSRNHPAGRLSADKPQGCVLSPGRASHANVKGALLLGAGERHASHRDWNCLSPLSFLLSGEPPVRVIMCFGQGFRAKPMDCLK